MMKKLLTITLVLYVIFVSFVLVIGFAEKQGGDEDHQSTPSSTATPRLKSTPDMKYSVADVSSHSSPSDCWLIINNNVYDVTSFLGEHPGGASTITPYCGKEATKAFDTQDRPFGGGHSSSAKNMLQDYLVGSIKQ